jgi:hypothetical protein
MNPIHLNISDVEVQTTDDHVMILSTQNLCHTWKNILHTHYYRLIHLKIDWFQYIFIIGIICTYMYITFY